jgi:hypothetical protein
MSRFLLTISVLALLLTFVLFACLGSATGAEPRYSWRPFADGSTDQVMLVDQHGTQVGVWRADDAAFAWRLNGDRWSPDCDPPIPPPPAPAVVARNYGVIPDEIVPGRVLLNGVPVNRARGIESLAAVVPDTQGKVWVTVIGPGREKVEADWGSAPELAPYRDRVILKSYPPDHWAVRPGFVAKGSPTVYVETSAGQVLSRTDGYEGPAALATALRKTDPSYDPSRDPDLTRPVKVEPILIPVPLPLPVLDPILVPGPQEGGGKAAPSGKAEQAPAPASTVSWSDLAAQVPPGAWSLIVAVAAALGFVLVRTAKGSAS